MRVLTVVGARPQFIKAAPVSRILCQRHTEILVHTGQHYDDAMSAGFFRELEIPEPDLNLAVGSGPHGAVTGEMLRGLERSILEHEPDGVLVYGDTNSTLAGALAAVKVAYAGGSRPWLAHVEAGLRSFNPAMPEERNRIVADHLADLSLAPTATATRNLEREGLSDRAELVGDVMVDAYRWALEHAGDHLPAVAREHERYVLVTLHRAENVDDPVTFARLAEALRVDVPVIFPVHPRTAAMLASGSARLPENVVTIDPVGYLQMVALEKRAYAIATDSGGVQKEAYLAGVPCITLRAETEWVETVDAGWNRVVGSAPGSLAAALGDVSFMRRDRPRPELFGDGRTAGRIVASLERLDARTRRPAPAQEAGVS